LTLSFFPLYITLCTVIFSYYSNLYHFYHHHIESNMDIIVDKTPLKHIPY
jgi:hypothetical protein